MVIFFDHIKGCEIYALLLMIVVLLRFGRVNFQVFSEYIYRIFFLFSSIETVRKYLKSFNTRPFLALKPPYVLTTTEHLIST